MPRRERIEYENAYYHVMNRGRGRQQIYHGRAYYEAFIEGVVIDGFTDSALFVP